LQSAEKCDSADGAVMLLFNLRSVSSVHTSCTTKNWWRLWIDQCCWSRYLKQNHWWR